MKANTHYIFSIGAGLYLLSILGKLSLGSALLVLWLSFAVNLVIDAAGHSVGISGNHSRTRITHSVFTAPVWGGAIGFASVWTISQLNLESGYSGYPFWILAGALVAFGHLFLDSLTQAGVYYWRERIAIAHFAYNNFLLNAGFALLGLMLGLLAILPIRLP